MHEAYLKLATPDDRRWKSRRPILACAAEAMELLREWEWNHVWNQCHTIPQGSLIQIWDARTGTHVRTYLGHNGKINALAFCPDSRVLASGGRDDIKLRRVETD